MANPVRNAGTCRAIADAIKNTVAWGDTPEGFEFWKRVTARFTAWGNAEMPTDSLLKIAPNDRAILEKRIALLEETLREKEEELVKTHTRIKELNRRLLAADFANFGRGEPKFR